MFLLQLIIVQVVIFGLVIFCLKKFIYSDTENAVSRLDESYQGINEQKEILSEKARKNDEEIQKKKAEADKLLEEQMEEGHQELAEKKDEMYKKAKAEAEKIVVDAQEMKKKLFEEVRKEEEAKSYERASVLLNSALSNVVKDKINTVLIEEFLTEFDNVSTSHIPATLVKADVTFSAPVSEELKTKIKTTISSKLSRDITIDEKIDANIVGGILVNFGGLVLDGSIAGKIKEITNKKVV